MNQTGQRDDIAGGLSKVLWTASQLDELSDFEDLLEAIRVLRPGWTGAGLVQAWRYLRRHAWMDARRVLEDDDEQAKRSALHSALMAVCLFGLEDPLWHGYARTAADQGEHAEAAMIANRLLERTARTQPHDGRETGAGHAAATAGSQFVPPTNWMRA